jgi:hypothetical protein
VQSYAQEVQKRVELHAKLQRVEGRAPSKVVTRPRSGSHKGHLSSTPRGPLGHSPPAPPALSGRSPHSVSVSPVASSPPRYSSSGSDRHVLTGDLPGHSPPAMTSPPFSQNSTTSPGALGAISASPAALAPASSSLDPSNLMPSRASGATGNGPLCTPPRRHSSTGTGDDVGHRLSSLPSATAATAPTKQAHDTAHCHASSGNGRMPAVVTTSPPSPLQDTAHSSSANGRMPAAVTTSPPSLLPPALSATPSSASVGLVNSSDFPGSGAASSHSFNTVDKGLQRPLRLDSPSTTATESPMTSRRDMEMTSGMFDADIAEVMRAATKQ